MKAILTFHSLDDSGSVLSFRPAMFADLVTRLLESGISICTIDQLRSGDPQPAVALSFDDGMQSVHRHALPVLRDAGVPAHLYLTTGYVGRDNQWPSQGKHAIRMPLMDWSEVQACADGGMLVENHTASHPDLCTLTAAEIEEECEAADGEIESRLGRRPEHFAYPYGEHSPLVAEVTGRRYRTCVTTELRSLSTRDPAHALPRLDTYYMQHGLLYSNPFGLGASNYLKFRNLLRGLKQRFGH
jgi:peptidoglycan/xylan/chitin deacetylase (PgdA/CDA1 family)